jgi:diguanylate cyclase (GGDEF)-like protein/PAS domain S-box-containing protein
VPAKKLMVLYWCLMIALLVAFFKLPDELNIPLWSAIGLTSVAAVVLGVIRNRPRRKAPWILMAAGLMIFLIGDTTYMYLTQFLGWPNPFPSINDAFYQVFYPLVIAALLMLPNSRIAGRDRAGILDALMLTAALALFFWVLLIDPYVKNTLLTPLQKVTSISYPLWDIIVVIIAARLVSSARKTVSVGLLAAGAAALFVADVLYGLSQLNAHWEVGTPIDVGWFLMYAAWGAAALHPSMVALTEPTVVRGSPVTGVRLVLLAVSALVPPAVLVVEGLNGPVRHGNVVAAFSAAIFMLVLLRLYGVVGVHRQAVARERGLREAGAALLSATDSAQVDRAVQEAVGKLVPPGTDHRVLLTVQTADARPGDHYPSPSGGGGAGLRFVRARELDARAADTLGGFEMTLVRPLALEDRPSGDPLVGELLVAAQESALIALSGAVDVLASQAALALERISLSNEIARRNSEVYFRTLVHTTADVILILNDDNSIRYASPSAETVFQDGGLAGRPLRDLVHPEDRELAWQILELVRAGHDGAGIADWTVLRADGGLVQVEVSCRDLRDDPTVGGLVLTLRDVTERRRLERELTHRAFHDSLTGLANRVLFNERVQHAVARARWSGAVVGVLFMDLDDFKVVNDTLGHEIGDQLLTAVGQRLAGVLRSNDTAARLGGDEFAVLIEDARDPEDVEQVADRIVKALVEPLLLGGSLVNGSASIGVSTTVDATDGRDLMRQADLALYVAKGAGKGQWRRYQSALHTALVERLELRSALDQAIADGAFGLEYQPIVTLPEGKTIGFEALVRWHHPTRGVILPNQFIEVAEDSGLIVPMGNWVLETALAAAAEWSGLAGERPYLSINVSALQFRSTGFVDKIRQELASTGTPPEHLMLEITESLLLRDDEQVWSDLATLREHGVRVAIDDFGTGYSSLSYLRQVPVDVVKIDKSFIDTMASSEQQRALVGGIVRLADTLGLQVVAEGIERPTDRDLLVDLGCPFGQGFLFSGPLAGGDIAGWLQAEHVAA